MLYVMVKNEQGEWAINSAHRSKARANTEAAICRSYWPRAVIVEANGPKDAFAKVTR